MAVELTAYTQPMNREGNFGPDPNPARVVEEAACVCYDSDPTPDFRIAKACARSGHLSVWEHISFTFHVTGVSRALLAQLTRHRHASFSVRSQRYCQEDGFGYVNPFGYDEDMKLRTVNTAMKCANRWYADLLEQGAAPEDARMVLPNACMTELYITMNARALIEASHLRMCNRAQEEIRMLFNDMRDELMLVCPEVANRMRPQCEAHGIPFCPEHKSCGRHPTLSDLVGAKNG